MKTYAAKSSVKRALKTSGKDANEYSILQNAEGKWYAEPKLQGLEGKVLAVDEATTLAETSNPEPKQEVEVSPQPKNKEDTRKKEIPQVPTSTATNPCKKVWEIAEAMPGARRKDIIAACVEQGVAFNTARTQYQQYYTAVKNSK